MKYMLRFDALFRLMYKWLLQMLLPEFILLERIRFIATRYRMNGGVLGDAIGYGKTCCTIGLIDCTQRSIPPSMPPPGRLPSNATLILCPANLVVQWADEFEKFLGEYVITLSNNAMQITIIDYDIIINLSKCIVIV